MSSRFLLPALGALLTLGGFQTARAEPRIITLKALPAQMRYDMNELMMEPGEEVKIVFEKPDDMPHNLVFFQPGTDVVAVSNKQMEKPEEALKRVTVEGGRIAWNSVVVPAQIEIRVTYAWKISHGHHAH